MSRSVWFGVTGSDNLRNSDLMKSWWCLPCNATEGDLVLLYCPRSVSAARQGIFAEARVLLPPSEKRKENSYCTGYGFGGKTRLAYAEIEIIERFVPTLTAKHMKSDPFLARTDLVRRNFQGTTFPIDEKTYQRMKSRLGDLAQSEK